MSCDHLNQLRDQMAVHDLRDEYLHMLDVHFAETIIHSQAQKLHLLSVPQFMPT